jgi:NAD(P)-dependent dehydrogenase (short-subunit alcohol dehydrogenase family)
MGRLNGKTAIVSGAARGIGAKTAAALAAEGANVVVTDRLAEVGEATVAAINQAGGSAAFMAHDVTDEADWARVVDDTVARFGGLQVLVNNAGVFLEKTIEEMTVEEWRRLSAVNLEGVFLGTKQAVRAMKLSCPPGGPSASIVNLSSIAGIIGSPWSSAYSMSKGGVRLFTKSAALEFAQLGYNVRVNSVHPGIINTDMMHEVAHKWQTINQKNDFDAAWAALSKRQPIGRMGLPDEIAKGIVFLASDDSSLMNGAELVLDGGITAE